MSKSRKKQDGPAEVAVAKMLERESPRLRSTKLLVELGIHKSEKAAADARCRRSPFTPPWIEISPAKIRYDPEVVERWLAERVVSWTGS